jgi:hypothetical protein
MKDPAGKPDHQGRPEHVCSATTEPDASGPNCQRGSLLAPANLQTLLGHRPAADRNHVDLDAPVSLNLYHRRPSRNNRSRHHGVANAGELPTCRPARVDIGGEPKTSTVSPRDASPTAPPPKDEASAHGRTRAPVCPARRDATGSWTRNYGHETGPLPKLADPARVNPKGELLIIRSRNTCTPTAELITPVRRDQHQTPPPPRPYKVCTPTPESTPPARSPDRNPKSTTRLHSSTHRYPRRPTRPAPWTTCWT